jgi:prepilin-type processing-associated H-X9-DG protein
MDYLDMKQRVNNLFVDGHFPKKPVADLQTHWNLLLQVPESPGRPAQEDRPFGHLAPDSFSTQKAEGLRTSEEL